MSNASASPRRVIHGHEMYSKFLKEERLIKVFVPPAVDLSEDSALHYPVVYCHDGNEFFTHGRIATLATQLMEAGELSPLFIVAVAVNMKHRTADYSPSGERHDDYVRFVMEEVIPFVESNYPIAPDNDQQFMAGISLGAAATLSIHMRYPEKFKRLLLFSGAFYHPQQETVQAVERFQDLHTYMAVGRQETAVETPNGEYDFYRFNLQMRDLLRLRGAEVDYHEADGKHIWGFWQSLIPQSLRWLNRQLPR